MIGRQIGGRYELLEKIGGGGMAIVYKARDILLNRKVAVKILREQYVHDEDFIRRFRREAQSAASLSHPNVVSIYDVGKEQDVHYIVMEYVAGSNLNEEIRRRAPFQVEEAVQITLQICDALDHAHQNHIIHRDIKPHNILIGRNGRVKVTDFGIARAASSTDITQTGSVIGSVHYLSPEHAKGMKQGEKSDIYSLGIVLYQMLTNQLPFSGDSPISVALKHLQEQVEPPRKLNPHIPPEVEAIILKTLQKSPEERYRSAKELLHDLETVVGERSDTKIRFMDKAMLQEDMDDHPTKVIPLKPTENDEEPTRLMPALRSSDQSLSAGLNESASSEKRLKQKIGSSLQPLKKHIFKAIIWFVLLFVFSIGTWYGVKSLKAIFVVPEVQVPNVVNMYVDDAVKLLNEKGLKAEKVYAFNHEVAVDHVISQESDPVLKVDSSVKLIISSGVRMETMPEVVDENISDVMQTLEALGVEEERIKITEDYSDNKEAGTVLFQMPNAGESFDPRTQIISLTVSLGSNTVLMPELVGQKQHIASSILTKLGLEPVIQESTSFTWPEGYVTNQWPFEPGKQVKVGSEIILSVSVGFPEDALELVYNIEVSPVLENVPTMVSIEVEDARGLLEWGSFNITQTEVIPVPVIVSNNHNAIIRYYIDNDPQDVITVTHKDAVKQGATKPEPLTEDDLPNVSSSSSSSFGEQSDIQVGGLLEDEEVVAWNLSGGRADE